MCTREIECNLFLDNEPCADSDLGGTDGFVEITNIECYTLAGSPESKFILSAETVNEFFEEVCFIKGSLYSDLSGIFRTTESDLCPLHHRNAFPNAELQPSYRFRFAAEGPLCHCIECNQVPRKVWRAS